MGAPKCLRMPALMYTLLCGSPVYCFFFVLITWYEGWTLARGGTPRKHKGRRAFIHIYQVPWYVGTKSRTPIHFRPEMPERGVAHPLRDTPRKPPEGSWRVSRGHTPRREAVDSVVKPRSPIITLLRVHYSCTDTEI